jgi:hypothetical protein
VRNSERALYPFAAIVAVLGVAVAILAVSAGRAALAALVLGIAAIYVVAIWSIRLRIPWVTALLVAAAACALGFLAGHVVIGVVFAALLVVWIARGAVVRLDADAITTHSGETLDPLTAANVSAFGSLGFEPVGALSFKQGKRKEIVAMVMIGARRDRYAVATDLVLTVQSVFGHRFLTTRNSAVGTLPPEVLANDLRGADPAELCDAHESALAVLRARGIEPDTLEPDALLASHMALERRAMEWMNSRARRQAVETFTRSGVGKGALDESSSSERRIDMWLQAAAPA